MSAAQWRRAMNTGLAAARPSTLRAMPTTPRATTATLELDDDSDAPRWLKFLWRHLSPRHVLLFLALLVFPFVASPFITFQIGGQALALGLIALSLTFLGGYGGMVSLAQLTVGGIAGYAVAILGHSSGTGVSLGWPWWVAVIFAVVIAVTIATLIGWLAVRTEGIYTIMITLAVGMAFYYLALQNYSLFNGFQGFQKVYPPTVFGIDWRSPTPFFYLTLFFALAAYLLVKWLIRTPFGLVLQGVRDNPRRMEALGYSVVAHRVAAYTVAGFIAAVGGILLTWYNGLITPHSLNSGAMINILVIAVLGGMKHPIGPFIGAVVFVLLQTFAIDLIERERFNLLIGAVFLLIVLFSPDGLLGAWSWLRARFGANRATSSQASSNLPRPQP